MVRVLRSGRYALGPEVDAFEGEFADYCQANHAAAVNSGTSALYLALRSCGIGPGDEVLTVPFTFVATVAAIEQTGATPRLVDIDPQTFTMDPQALERGLTTRTRAIVPVHLFGHPADMDPILEVAASRDLRVVEDACQAHGARYKGRPVGTIGDCGCFSFYPSKNLGACGEGGIIVSQNPAYAATARMLRDWGQDRPRHHALRGGNYRLEAIQAAVLRVKLAHLASWTRARQRIAARYTELLEDAAVVLPQVRSFAEHVYHVYAIRAPRRDALAGSLTARGIGVGMHYPLPIHLQPAYADLGYSRGSLPHAEAAAAEELSLPMYAELSDASVGEVAQAIRDYTASG